MMYAQTVEVPADRRIMIEVPAEIPAGVQARVSFFIEDTHAVFEDALATEKLRKTVEMMAAEYARDSELTAFCALDGDDFYEAR